MNSPLRPTWRRVAGAGLVSFCLHVFGVIPYGIARLIHPPQAELEVAYLPDITEGEDPAPAGPAEATDPADAPDKTPPKKDTPPKELLAEPEDPARRKPPEKPPDPTRPPPLEVLPNAHLKMVDQEQFPDEADNADARYLAQKNHRAEKETRAEDSNLLRSQAGERVSTESQNNKPQPGDAETKIAELSDHAGPRDRLPVLNQPRGENPASQQKDPQKAAPSPLAMRDVVPMSQEPARDIQRDGIEVQEQGAGPLPMARLGKDDHEVARAGQAGAPGRFSLNHLDYDRIVGFDVSQKERQDALTSRSQTGGRWQKLDQKLAMMRSSLENFTPAVQPGNQSELGTRRHPFAAYIAAMHRQIHKFWGFGYLLDLDNKGSGSPYNDMGLWTSVEIALKPDGSVHRLVISHHSGLLPFDTAALDAVMTAGPFQPPPESIKSRDGYVYLDWRFHRDGRQCATDWVEPHILTTPPKDGGAAVATGKASSAPVAGSEPPRPAMVARPDLLGALPARERRARPGGGEGGGGGRGGEEEGRGRGGRSGGEGAGEGRSAAAEEGRGRRSGDRSADAPEPAPDKGGEVPQAAQAVAQKWLAAYEKGDVRWLAGSSAVPFTTGGKTTAEDADELRAMYREMLAERGAGKAASATLSFLTPSQIKKRLGKLPAGGDEEGMMFAWLRGGGDDLVLLLQPADRGWRVVGIAR